MPSVVRRTLCLAAFSLLSVVAVGDDTASPEPQVGDCVLFREGGAGLLLTTPVYWLRGTVNAVAHEQRKALACPRIGKPQIAYTPADHARVAAAMPCVAEPGEDLEVKVTRVQVAVDDWETPWSPQQGTTGWLFRGRFLEQTLAKGKVIDMAANWLTTCGGGR